MVKHVLLAIVLLSVEYFTACMVKIKTEERAITKTQPVATDFFVDFKMGWLRYDTYEEKKLIAIPRLSYMVTEEPVVWPVWNNNTEGLRFTEWGKYILWRTK